MSYLINFSFVHFSLQRHEQTFAHSMKLAVHFGQFSALPSGHPASIRLDN